LTSVNAFRLIGLGVDGKIAFRIAFKKEIRRLGLRDAFEKLPPCIAGTGGLPQRGLR
jgi:hypothetical protein